MIKTFEKILNLNYNKRDDFPYPPKEMRDLIGAANLFWFNQIGYEFVKHFINQCGLKPEETVLDIGCGCGRMARPLSQYLEKGRYEGIDIVPLMINWCQ